VSNIVSKDLCVNESKNSDRRAVLKKLGRFGVYTAPVMLTALQATKAVAASDSGAAW
jgi:hypothetical protein